MSRIGFVGCALELVALASLAWADTSTSRAAVGAQGTAPQPLPEATTQWLNAVVRDVLPKEYVDERKWGQTTRMLDGLHMRRDGLELKTKRKWKAVNHGTWKRYVLRQIDPQENLRVRLVRVELDEDGQAEFEVQLLVTVDAEGRLAEWWYGVQLASVSMVARCRVQLDVVGRMQVQLDPTRIPPDLVLKPHVDQAQVQLRHFEVHQISKLHGSLARELGDGLESLVRRKLREKSDKLPEKINRQIAKRSGRLRLSIHELAAKQWRQWMPLIQPTDDQESQ